MEKYYGLESISCIFKNSSLLYNTKNSFQFVGKTVTMEDGQQFKIFMHAAMSTKPNGENSAIFKVRFHLANMSPKKILDTL